MFLMSTFFIYLPITLSLGGINTRSSTTVFVEFRYVGIFYFSRKHLTIFVLERHRPWFGSLSRKTNFFFLQRGGFETTLLFGSTTERSTVFSLGGHVNFFRFCRRAHVPNGSSAVGTLEPKFSSGRTKRPSVVWVEAFLKVRRERPASRHSLDVRCRSGRDGRLASNRQFLRSAAKTVAAGSAGSVRTASGTMSFVRRARFLLFLNGRKRFTVDNADRYATGRPSSR